MLRPVLFGMSVDGVALTPEILREWFQSGTGLCASDTSKSVTVNLTDLDGKGDGTDAPHFLVTYYPNTQVLVSVVTAAG